MPEIKACEVCGSTNLETRTGPLALGVSCAGCGAGFDYFFRKDGAVLDYPRAWGKLIAVVAESESTERFSPEHRGPEGSPEGYLVRGNFVFVFQADDGTIRGVRAERAEFPKGGPRPAGVPAQVRYYHTWVVNVCPCRGPGGVPPV